MRWRVTCRRCFSSLSRSELAERLNIYETGNSGLGKRLETGRGCRVTRATDPQLKDRTYGYDAAGNLTSQTDRLGQTRLFTYDNLNRVQHEDWLNSSAAVTRKLSWDYDRSGLLLNTDDRLASGSVLASAERSLTAEAEDHAVFVADDQAAGGHGRRSVESTAGFVFPGLFASLQVKGIQAAIGAADEDALADDHRR